MLDDPLRIRQIMGDKQLPLLKVPGAIFQGVVHW